MIDFAAITIGPGRYLTRGGEEVYIACWSERDDRGISTDYPWWVEGKNRGWSVDNSGKHMKGGPTEFDIVSRFEAQERMKA